MRDHLFKCLYLLLVALLSQSCRHEGLTGSGAYYQPMLNMEALIQNSRSYDNLPSASGLEMLGNHFYVVGDDSPYLYRLDRNFQIVSQEAMFDTVGFETGRIAKEDKPDLESMTLLQYQGKPYLLMMGSGSAANRRKAFLYNICGDDLCREGEGVQGARTVDLEELYQQLEAEDTLGGASLNIEGVAAGHGQLYLLQRATGTGQNVLISYHLAEFIPYLLGSAGAKLPQHELTYFRLPELNYLQAGFSGAYVFDDKLFFTASLEDTNDAIQDGAVLGSYIGYIPFNRLARKDTLQLQATLIMQPDGKPYTGKAESLVVTRRESRGKYRLIVVSDDDLGGSELIELVLNINP